MKATLPIALFLLLAAAMSATELTPSNQTPAETNAGGAAAAWDELVGAQPKLVRISASVDGSGKIVFTRSDVRYEHKHWALPANVVFDGEPWTNLNHTPPAWSDYSARLDLTKAWIVKRAGRDLVSLESTPDGFDLYLCDSPNGAADYQVTIAIPRRR